jgi:hypothetical protein
VLARSRPHYAGGDTRNEHEQHIGMFSLEDHIATRATMTLGLPDKLA